MKRVLAVMSLALLLVSAVVFSRLTSKSQMHITYPITAKGLDSDGIYLITPSSPEWEMTTSKTTLEITDASGPFGLFVKNTTDRDVVGCSLEWVLTNSDGTVRSLHQTYSNPGVLVGMKPADPNMIGHTSLINANSTKFLSLDPYVKAMFEARESQPEPLSQRDRDSLKRVEAAYNKQLRTAVSITIILDGVVFSDGEFVGPDTAKFLPRLEAFVNAKRDIATFVRSAVAEGKSSPEILDNLDSQVRSPFKSKKTRNEEYDRIYDSYFKTFAEELQGVRKKAGDEKAVTYAQNGLDKYRQLHKRNK